MEEELDPSLALWGSWESFGLGELEPDSEGAVASSAFHLRVDEGKHTSGSDTADPSARNSLPSPAKGLPSPANGLPSPANSLSTHTDSVSELISHSLNPAISRLPNEILDAIIRDIPCCQEICSVVCRRWRIVTLPLRFRTLVISGDRMLRHPDWLSFWMESPWLTVNVQIARLSGCSIALSELDTLLNSFPSLHSLDLQHVRLQWQPTSTSADTGHAHRIADLHITSHYGESWFDDLVDILGLFSEIGSFYASGGYFPASPRAIHPGKLQIRTIRPSNEQQHYMSDSEITSYLTGIDAFRSLTSLAVLRYTYDLDDLGGLLFSTGKTLKSLSLTISCLCDALPPTIQRDYASERQSCIDHIRAGLVACVHLEDAKLRTTVIMLEDITNNMDLRSELYHHIWHIAVDLMRLVSSTQLRTLGFAVAFQDWAYVADPSCLSWDEMKAACRSLDHLECIEVDMNEEDAQNYAARELKGFRNVRS